MVQRYATVVMELVDYVDCVSLLNEEKFNDIHPESYMCIMLQSKSVVFLF
jgi:hypothetical protein